MDHTITIYAFDGTKVVARSKNLRGVFRRVGKVGANSVTIWKTLQGGGYLQIIFSDNSYVQTTYEDYNVLCGQLRRWRNLYGVNLYAAPNGKYVVPVGDISRNLWVLCNPQNALPLT